MALSPASAADSLMGRGVAFISNDETGSTTPAIPRSIANFMYRTASSTLPAALGRILDAHAQLQLERRAAECLALKSNEGDLAVFEEGHVLRAEVHAFRREFRSTEPLNLRCLLTLDAFGVLHVEEVHVPAADDLIRVAELY